MSEHCTETQKVPQKIKKKKSETESKIESGIEIEIETETESSANTMQFDFLILPSISSVFITEDIVEISVCFTTETPFSVCN